MADFYDLVAGPKAPEDPDPYNVKWHEEAREAAQAHREALEVGSATDDDTGIVGTPYTPQHFFDQRDGEVTVDPIFETS